MTSKSKDFDAKAFVDHMMLPTNTFLTVDPTGGYLTVGGKGDLEKAKKTWEKAGASITTEQLAQVRDLFAPKSSKAAAPVTGMQVWCMKCKCNVALRNPVAQVAKNGKKMTKGECAQCGGPVYSFKAMPDTATPKDNPMTKADKAAFVKAHSKLSGKAKADATTLSNVAGMTEARLDKWIASWKIHEAGTKTSAKKETAKSSVNETRKPSAGIKIGAVARFYCGKCKSGVDVKILSMDGKRAHGTCPKCQSNLGRGVK